MPNCYKCGVYIPPNGGYKRRVKTGDSFGMSFGRRIVPSIRTYFGPRTLCVDCARQHDKFEKIKNFFWIILIGGFVIYLITPSCKSGLNSKTNFSSSSNAINSPSGHTSNINDIRNDFRAIPNANNNTSETIIEQKLIDIEILSGVLMRVSSPELNIRSGPGTQYNIISSASFGDVVSVTNTNRGWSYIGSGWVRSKHLNPAEIIQ